MKIGDCGHCVAKLRNDQHLRGAAASVGIEHGMTTTETIVAYLREYHINGHQEAPSTMDLVLAQEAAASVALDGETQALD